MEKENSWVGKEVERTDEYEKVTGQATYTQDVELPGMLYTRIAVSEKAHAKILNIDTSEAEEIEGVRVVLTGEDVGFKFGKYIEDRNLLAKDKVVYYGEPVAAVAADSEEIAEKAVEKIEVEYEELEPIFDPKESVKEEENLIHEDMSEFNHAPFIFPKDDTNIANHFKLRKGDVEEGFEEADKVITNTFDQPQTQHVEMETHTTVAQWNGEEGVEIYTSAQAPFVVQENIHRMFDIPMNKVEVNTPYLGGGFGGKAGLNWEPLPILLSKKAGGRPVKIDLKREEQFRSSAVRQGMKAELKTGVKENGEITGMEIKYFWDSGPYADYSVNVTRAAGYASPGPYEIPNIKTDSYTAYTNHVYGTAFRGFGHVPFFWATERQMDLVAKELDMDPVELREKNIILPGGTAPSGVNVRDKVGRIDECIDKVVEELDKVETGETEDGKLRGTGVATLWKAPAMPANTSSSALVKINEDGTVTLVSANSQMGQGSVTSFLQLVADELDIPYEDVDIANHTDTDLSVYTWQTVGSRGTFMDGNAVLDACEKTKKQLKELASESLKTPEDKLKIEDGKVVEEHGEGEVPFSEIATGGTRETGEGFGGPIAGYGTYSAERTTNLDPDTGQGAPGLAWTVGARGAVVEVDPETGKTDVKKLITSLDVGKELNPQSVDGQIYGAVVQHLGSTLTEEYMYDDEGRMINDSLTDYKIPRAEDIPDEMINKNVENPQENAPFGARGVGELGMISVGPAVANAVADATGVEFYDLPLSRQNVWKKFDKELNQEEGK